MGCSSSSSFIRHYQRDPHFVKSLRAVCNQLCTQCDTSLTSVLYNHNTARLEIYITEQNFDKYLSASVYIRTELLIRYAHYSIENNDFDVCVKINVQ